MSADAMVICRKFDIDVAKLKAKAAIQDAEDRAVFNRVSIVIEEDLVEIFGYSETRLPVLGDLATYLWEQNPKLADESVIRLRVGDVMEDSRRWKLWADCKIGTWPVWFHPYSLLVYLEEHEVDA